MNITELYNSKREFQLFVNQYCAIFRIEKEQAFKMLPVMVEASKYVGRNLAELYKRDKDFRRYVDRHARHYGISTEEALEHALVRNYAAYLEELKA